MKRVKAALNQQNPPVQAGSPHSAYGPYLYAVIGLGVAAVASSAIRLQHLDIGYQWLILASLTVLTSTYCIKIPAINSKISIGDTLYFTNVLLFGTAAGVITAALDGLAGSIRARTRSRRLQYTLFNMAAMACSAHVAGSLFFYLAPPGLVSREQNPGFADMLLPLGVLAFTHYLVNSGSVAIIVALEKRKNVLGIWKESFLWTSITYFAGAAAAGFIAITIGAVTPQVLGVAVPVLLAVYFTYKTYLEKVDEVRSLAYYDSLTGLPNRVLFKEQLDEALAWSERRQIMLAVMFLDVDHFKRVNDTYGHSIGDLLLRSVASRLTASVRTYGADRLLASEDQTLVIGRFGGDEFTVLMKGISGPQDATRIAQRFLQALSQPYSLDGQEVNVAATIGISIYPFDGTNADMLLRNADAALYHAKDNGRSGFHLYSRSISDKSSEKLSLENQLRKALNRGEFEVHYQPKLDVLSGRICGAEALMRWRHPTRGLLPASDFVALTEETGLIKPIGEWMLRAVCSQLSAWLKDGKAVVPIAVNLSPLQFRQENLVEMIARILQETSLDQAYLELELTESAIMENEQEADASLSELRALGMRISVDDFGTGYSSLSRLKRFKLDALKIDRSFVTDCAGSPDDRAIISAIVAMARSLDLKVVAEGVETEQQLHFLKERGCDEMQGDYICRPIPSDEFACLLNGANGLPPPVRNEYPAPFRLIMTSTTSSGRNTGTSAVNRTHPAENCLAH